jgi:hypothetical protein
MSRTTPWADSEEWFQVFKNLYSVEEEKRLLGINRVKAWANRTKLPHSIESTSNLVEVGLQGRKKSSCSEKEISLLLCMALIRFVNGLVDAAQKGTVATSAIGIAEQLDLPIWLVEIRHQATHDRIPPLSQLRRARLQALDWLRVHYWEIQATAVQDTKETLCSLLIDYHDTRCESLLHADNSNGKLQKLLNSITSILTSDNYSELLFPSLLQPGALFPSNAEHQVGYNTEFLEDDYIIKVWSPLLKSCESKWNGFAGALFHYMVDEFKSNQNHDLPLYWSTLNTWCKFLIRLFMMPWQNYDCDLIVKNCLKQSNVFTKDILEYMDHLDQIPNHLKRMYAIFQERMRIDDQFEKGILTSDVLSEFQAENLYQELEELSNRIPKNAMNEQINEVSAKEWEVMSTWTKCPIGLIPGATRVANLELDSSFDDPNYLEEMGLLYYPSEQKALFTGTRKTDEIIVDNVFLI